MENEIQAYIKALNNLANNDDGMVFDNKGSEHASAVMGTIFKHAQEYVYIYANDMNGDISKDHYYLDELRGFLERNGKIRIFLDSLSNFDNSELLNPSITLLRNYKNNNAVEVKEVTENFKNEMISIAKKKTLYHFAIADNKMVRIEEDNITHKAPFCSFNHPDYALKLRTIFDSNF